MLTLDEQLDDFAALGEVFDPGASEEAFAAELADTLMRQPSAAGPLERITRLTNLLKILRRVVRIVTAHRDHQAYAATAFWPYRRLAAMLGVNGATMQGWVRAGAKVAPAVSTTVAAQAVSRGTVAAAC